MMQSPYTPASTPAAMPGQYSVQGNAFGNYGTVQQPILPSSMFQGAASRSYQGNQMSVPSMDSIANIARSFNQSMDNLYSGAGSMSPGVSGLDYPQYSINPNRYMPQNRPIGSMAVDPEQQRLKMMQEKMRTMNERDQYQADLATAASFAPTRDQSGNLRDRGGFLAPSNYIPPSAEDIADARRFGVSVTALGMDRGRFERAKAAGVQGYNDYQQFKREEEYGPVLQKYFNDMQSRARKATEARIAATGSMMPAGPTQEQQFMDYISKLASQGYSVLTGDDQRFDPKNPSAGGIEVDASGNLVSSPRTRAQGAIKLIDGRLAQMDRNMRVYNTSLEARTPIRIRKGPHSAIPSNPADRSTSFAEYNDRPLEPGFTAYQEGVPLEADEISEQVYNSIRNGTYQRQIDSSKKERARYRSIEASTGRGPEIFLPKAKRSQITYRP